MHDDDLLRSLKDPIDVNALRRLFVLSIGNIVHGLATVNIFALWVVLDRQPQTRDGRYGFVKKTTRPETAIAHNAAPRLAWLLSSAGSHITVTKTLRCQSIIPYDISQVYMAAAQQACFDLVGSQSAQSRHNGHKVSHT